MSALPYTKNTFSPPRITYQLLFKADTISATLAAARQAFGECVCGTTSQALLSGSHCGKEIPSTHWQPANMILTIYAEHFHWAVVGARLQHLPCAGGWLSTRVWTGCAQVHLALSTWLILIASTSWMKGSSPWIFTFPYTVLIFPWDSQLFHLSGMLFGTSPTMFQMQASVQHGTLKTSCRSGLRWHTTGGHN